MRCAFLLSLRRLVFLSLLANLRCAFLFLIRVSFFSFLFPFFFLVSCVLLFLLSCCHYVSFLLPFLFPSSFPSFPFPFFFPWYTLLSWYLAIPYSFLPWYIPFPFIWPSLAFSSFPSMFTLLAIIFPHIASYGYSMQYYII